MRKSAGGDAGGTIRRVVVGTAGHIDHGKSSLVKRLTGIDPDRLPEEKARGLTIDLGFANYRLSDGSRLGLVDVPGHERFVHNMVAGATGIDLALLVVAADDGVMPQTIEHLEILELLGLKRGAIALTKIDLVGAELRELVVEQMRETVAGTFLEGAPFFPVSSATGEGFDELRAGLESLVSSAPPRESGGVFRMPIQRVFAAKGFGCVVTGIPLSGSLGIGDRVEVAPGPHAATVRGLEAYHQSVERIAAGHSSALNLGGLDAAGCARGMAVVTPSYFAPVRFFEARVRHLKRRRRPLRHREELRLHVGTEEVAALLLLLDRGELAPGEEAHLQLVAEKPIVVGTGDRFLLRIPSPAETVGGGVIVSTTNRRLRRNDPSALATLEAFDRALSDPREKLRLELARAGLDAKKPSTLARALGLLDADCERFVDSLATAGSLHRLRNGSLIDSQRFEEACARADAAIRKHFEAHPERLVCDRVALAQASRLESALLDEVLAELARRGRIEVEAGGGARLAQALAPLAPAQQKLHDAVLARLITARFQPPTHDELALELGVRRAELDAILKRLVDEKSATRVSPEYHFAAKAIDEAKEAIRRNCAARATPRQDGDVDLPSLRDVLQTTRRWLIPLMEWFDGTGFTTRLGARRILKRR